MNLNMNTITTIGLSLSLYSKHGCNIIDIINTMENEQRDHHYHNFGDTYIKYRKVVGEWMIEVCAYLNLHITTTHAAIAYLDRLQPNEKFSRLSSSLLSLSPLSLLLSLDLNGKC